MSVPARICTDDRARRKDLRATELNGLDYLEVDEDDRHRLTIYFISKLGPLADSLGTANFIVAGGVRVRSVIVTDVEVCEQSDAERDDCMTLTVDRIGDFSTYTLCVVAEDCGRPTETPHPGFDPMYACLEFSFQAGCPSTTDCRVEELCPEEPVSRPDIDYLAKDYASFRQILLNRLSLLMPGWDETHEPDLLVTLVELLAYEGDRLSYYQDAVATEAYLQTGRQRISVRRHARLVDYFLHEGCNSRAWLFVETSQDSPWMAWEDIFFVTRYSGSPPRGTVLSEEDLRNVPPDAYLVFEPVAQPRTSGAPRCVPLDPAKVCRRIVEAGNPAAGYIRRELSPPVREALENWDGQGEPDPDLTQRVLGDLDRISRTQALYTAKPFERHCHSDAAQHLLCRPLRGCDIVELNCVLLQAAFEDDPEPSSGGVRLYECHNKIVLHTWGERDCCLPRGTTVATLVDAAPAKLPAGAAYGGPPGPPSYEPPPGGYAPPAEPPPGSYAAPAEPAPASYASPADSPPGAYGEPTPPPGYGSGPPAPPPQPQRCLRLAPGDLVLFEEVRDPSTGLAEDADPAHRHVVRLTRVTETFDPVLRVALLEVEWAPEDALPFPLCLSARGPAPECEWLECVSVARGNILLVDHGRSRLQELDAVEVDAIDQPCDDCRPEAQLVARRYSPVLAEPDLTFSQPLTAGASATGTLVQDPHLALPHVRLQQVPMAPPRLDVPDPLERYRNPLPLTAFDPEDLVAPAPLLARLQDPAKDPVAGHLLELLDEATKSRLDDYDFPDDPSPELVAGLLRALNAALDDEDLYEEQRFPRAALDEPTKTLLGDPSLPLDLRRLLRRWLLEQAVPEALGAVARWVRDWAARFDLLASTGDDRHFVVEMTDDRRAPLRFGDDDLGQRPEPVSRFRAFYRVGSGPQGNVGAETIAYLVQRHGVLEGLRLTPRNPLPAIGGTDPETLDEARVRAPYSIRRNLARAITASDYAALAARDFAAQLQGAAAELIWNGSWYEAHVTLDPWGREDVAQELLDDVRRQLEHYRRMGHGLHVASARYVPLDIVLAVCVKPGYQRAHVRAALEDAFASCLRDDGRPGFFHPDNMRFRSTVDVSEIVALAQGVEGVLWCRVTKLERLGEGDASELEDGTLPVAAVEIPRVDSRNGFPEYGSITFAMDGGR